MPVFLHYEISGRSDGPTLVLSGSVGSSAQMWEPNLATLGEHFRVIRLDHRGHGASPTPAGPYAIADLAADALDTLGALGVERFSWCGLSMGAMVGMSIAASRPETVDKLVLCCTSAGFADPSVWTERAIATADGGTAPLAEGIVERWFTPGWARAHPSVVQQAIGWVLDTSDKAYRYCCEAIARWDHHDQLSAIKAPTLVIAGEHDTATPVEHARVIAEGVDAGRLEVVEAAHLATIEAPRMTAQLVCEHLCKD